MCKSIIFFPVNVKAFHGAHWVSVQSICNKTEAAMACTLHLPTKQHNPPTPNIARSTARTLAHYKPRTEYVCDLVL